MNQSEKYNIALSFWTMSASYLNTVEAVTGETIKHKNDWVIIFDVSEKFSWDKFSWEEYDLRTKWSDFKIIIPTIYNFYHGLELMLKGFIILKGDKEIKLDHDIEKLFNNFKNKYTDEEEINKILKKYILLDSMIEPLKTFFRENNISTNKFYFALRYPCDQKLNDEVKHFPLKYRGEKGVDFFETLKNDTVNLRKMFVKLSRKYK